MLILISIITALACLWFVLACIVNDGFLALIITSFFGIILLGYLADGQSCIQKYVDHKPTYGFFSGCMIEVEGKRIPSENWRVL